jgi:DHA1 family tetracycline resistance protein-like MFS transporter
VGISLFCVGVGAAVVQGFLARVLVPKFGERNSLIFGLALGVLTFVGYGWAPHGWIVYCIIAVGSIGAIAQPAVQAMITHSVRPEEQGAVQGTLASLQSIAGIAGPIIGGSVFWYFVSDHVSTKIPGAPFYSGAIISALGLIVALWALRRYGHHADAPHAPAPPISSTTTDTTAPTAAH